MTKHMTSEVAIKLQKREELLSGTGSPELLVLVQASTSEDWKCLA